MSNADDDALSIVEAYHRAWTSGDVDRALTYVSDDVRCFAPDENVATKSRLARVPRQLRTDADRRT